MRILLFLLIGFLLSLFLIDYFFNLKNILLSFQYNFFQFSIFLVIFFTFIVIFRYIVFLFLSLLKTTQKTIEFRKRNINYNPKVTIIVPAYNEDLIISSSIKSLIKQTYKNLEIIIIDDGSSDNTYKIAKKFEGKFEDKDIKIFTKQNGGKSRALNFGIERSKGELIMCVDADSKLDNDAVSLMVRYFENPDISAVAGSVFVNNRNNILTKLQALEYIEGLNMVRNAQAFLRLVNIIPGPIGMFRKSALLEVGGYEHNTFAEDCDLTLKLIEKNHKIDFEPDAMAHTEAPEELLELIKQRYRWTRGILQAIRKHSKNLWNLKNANFTLILWYMLFEAILWPFIDFFASTLVVYISFTQGINNMLIFWWVLFTIVDISGAMYCVLITNESKLLIPYAIFYRLYFISIINISKIFATIEEWFNIEMNWGKLKRKGGI